MANPDIALLGAVYPTVSGIQLPKNGGGVATFPFVEGSQTVTQNGTYDVTNLAEFIVNVAGSSVEIESGTFSPANDTSHPTISFSKTHSAPPSFVWIAHDGFVNTSSMMGFVLCDPVALFGFPLYYNGSSTRKGFYFRAYRGTGTAATFDSGVITNGPDASGSSDNTYYRYYATESAFKPYSGSAQRYFRSSNTFSWKAYWL